MTFAHFFTRCAGFGGGFVPWKHGSLRGMNGSPRCGVIGEYKSCRVHQPSRLQKPGINLKRKLFSAVLVAMYP